MLSTAYQALKTAFTKTAPVFATKPSGSLGVMRKMFSPVQHTMGYMFKGYGDEALSGGIKINTGHKLTEYMSEAVKKSHDYFSSVEQPLVKMTKDIHKSIGDDGYDMLMKSISHKGVYKDSPEYVKWFNSLSQSSKVSVGKYQSIARDYLDDMLVKGQNTLRFVSKDPKGKELWKPILDRSKSVGSYVPTSNTGNYIIFTPNVENLDIIKEVRPEHVMKGLVDRVSKDTYEEAIKYIKDNNLFGKSIITTDGFVPSAFKSMTKDKEMAQYITNKMLGKGAFIPKTEGDKIYKKYLDMAWKPKNTEEDIAYNLAKMKARIGEDAYEALRTAKTERQISDMYRDFKSLNISEFADRPFSANALRKHFDGLSRAGFKYTPEQMISYIHTMGRKINLSEATGKWVSYMDHPAVVNMKGGKQYMSDILENVLGRNHGVEWLTKYTKRFGIDERQVVSAANTIMQAQAMLKIGINPLLPLINATQLWINTGAVLGFKWVGKAYAFSLTEEGRKLIREAGYTLKLHGGDVPKFLEGLPPGSGNKFLGTINDYILAPFKAVEIRHNRALSYIAGYLKATEEMGKTGKSAHEFAERIVNLTQFPYGTASQPWIMRYTPVKLAGQFKTYFLGQLFFMEQLAKNAVNGVASGKPEMAYPFLKMMGAYGVIGGTATVPGIQYFRERSAKLNELEMKYPTVARGLPSLAGVDISYKLGMEFPDKDSLSRFFLGPTYTNAIQGGLAAKELIKHGQTGEHMTRFLRGISPGIGAPLRVKGGKVVDARGQVMSDPGSKAMAYASQFGFQSEDAFKQTRMYQRNKIFNKRRSDFRRHHINRITKMKLDGKMREADAEMARLNQNVVPGTPYNPNIRASDINRALRAYQTPLGMRNVSKRDAVRLGAVDNVVYD